MHVRTYTHSPAMLRGNLLIALLWTVFTVSRIFPSSIPDPSMSPITGEEPDTLRFAAVKLKLSMLNLAAMVRRPSHFKPVLWNAPIHMKMTLWMLVLSGDVEINPGPPS